MTEVSPHRRGQIIRAVAAEGVFRGRVDGHKVSIGKSDQPDLYGRRIFWEIVLRRRSYNGLASTIFDALNNALTTIQQNKGKRDGI
jgi:hypothetical protein